MPIFLHQIKSSEIHKYFSSKWAKLSSKWANSEILWSLGQDLMEIKGRTDIRDSRVASMTKIKLNFCLHCTTVLIWSFSAFAEFIIKSRIVHHHNPVDMTMSEGGRQLAAGVGDTTQGGDSEPEEGSCGGRLGRVGWLLLSLYTTVLYCILGVNIKMGEYFICRLIKILICKVSFKEHAAILSLWNVCA